MHLPAPVRAAVGLVATAAEEARRLPDRAVELPMLAVSTALQASLRAQQRYARLTARGDEVLGRGRTTDEPPAWATFDDPVSEDELQRTTRTQEQEAAVSADPPASAPPRVRKATPKKVSKPRYSKPSAFDDAPDEPAD